MGRIVRLSGDVAGEGRQAVAGEDARAVEPLLRDFLSREPILPLDRERRIDLAGFAALLAPLCRLLRGDVSDALADSRSPLVQLAGDWRQHLFPDATDAQFADAYAQTAAFALLLGRSEGADPLTLDSAVAALAAQHGACLSDRHAGAALAGVARIRGPGGAGGCDRASGDGDGFTSILDLVAMRDVA